jgi:hypothetical protein
LGAEVLGTAEVGLTDVGDDVSLSLKILRSSVLGAVLGLAVVGLTDVGAEVLGVELGIAVVGLTDVGAEVIGDVLGCGRTNRWWVIAL